MAKSLGVPRDSTVSASRAPGLLPAMCVRSSSGSKEASDHISVLCGQRWLRPPAGT